MSRDTTSTNPSARRAGGSSGGAKCFQLGRERTNRIHQDLRGQQQRQKELHPALLLHHGLAVWPGSEDASDGGKAELIAQIAALEVREYYRAALARWKHLTQGRHRFTVLECEIAGRLYIGVTRDSPLEAGVTVSHTYGVPMIPGSALKGLARAGAQRLVDGGVLDAESFHWMFGVGGDEGDIGGVIFHDAWWDGNGSKHPFVPEIVTPHQSGYYTSKGEEAPSDTASPIPAPQIAVQGGFYIVIEGPTQWAEAVKVILQAALEAEGIGAKRSSGYGILCARGRGDTSAAVARR